MINREQIIFSLLFIIVLYYVSYIYGFMFVNNTIKKRKEIFVIWYNVCMHKYCLHSH